MSNAYSSSYSSSRNVQSAGTAFGSSFNNIFGTENNNIGSNIYFSQTKSRKGKFILSEESLLNLLKIPQIDIRSCKFDKHTRLIHINFEHSNLAEIEDGSMIPLYTIDDILNLGWDV